MTIVLQLVLSGLCVGSIYTLVALGFNLIFSTKRILNFAQGEFIMIGAMMGYSGYVLLGLPLVIASLIAAVTGALIGVVVERVAIRQFKDPHRAIGWVMTTVGISIILKNSAQQIWGSQAVPFPPFAGQNPIRLLGLVLVPQELYTLIIAIVIVLCLESLYYKTIIGKAIKATAFDAEVANLMGIKSTQMVILAFAASGVLAALAGILISPIAYAGANMGTILGIKGFAAAALGGFGSIRGSLMGGLLLGLVEVLTSGLIWSGFQNIIAFAILIVVLVLRPTGITGQPVVERV